MKRTAYELVRSSVGYSVYELTIEEGKVLRRRKMIEDDFLTISVMKLSNHLYNTAPDNLKPVPVQADRAVAEKSEQAKKADIRRQK